MATKSYSLRLTTTQAGHLDYLTEVYGSQAAAFRVAIEVLFTLKRMEELGLSGQVNIERLRECLQAQTAHSV